MKAFLSLMADATVKATILLILAALAALLARRASASTRHLIWTLGLGAALALPILSVILPQWHAPLPRITSSTAAEPNDTTPADVAAPVMETPTTVPSSSAYTKVQGSVAVLPTEPLLPSPRSESRQRMPFRWFAIWPAILVVTWLLGGVCVLFRLVQSVIAIRRIGRSSSALVNRRLLIASATALETISSPNTVSIQVASDISNIKVPITWGGMRPTILLPADANSWPEERVTAALLHELAHVRRWDWPLLIAARIVCAIYWFHPLVWLSARKMREESETACDDLVLLTGMPAPEYARHLLDVALSARTQHRIGLGAVAMAQTSNVEGRLRSVLTAKLSRHPITKRAAALCGIAAIVVALPLAAVKLGAVAQLADGVILASDTIPSNATVTRSTRGVLALALLRDVACPSSPYRPITLNAIVDASGVNHYVFHDKRTGKNYRDMEQIKADFAQVLAQGVDERSGATLSPVPYELAAKNKEGGLETGAFFTPEQQARTKVLDAEAQGWADRDFKVVLDDGDFEPTATASNGPQGPTLSLSLTHEGQEKYISLTRAHAGEYMGVYPHNSHQRLVMLVERPADATHLVLHHITNTLAEAQALAQRMNEPAGTEVVGGGVLRATYPDGLIYESDEDAGQKAASTSGYSAVLPNGCTVEVEGIEQAAQKGNKWVKGGPSWSPNGTPMTAQKLPIDSSWSWPLKVSDHLAPHWIQLHITPPSGQPADTEISTYTHLIAATQAPWSRTFSRWGDEVGAFYPVSDQPGTLRVGVAVGPWRQAAALPVHLRPQDLSPDPGGSPWPLEIKLDDRPALLYKDRSGHSHIEYFLPPGQRLGNVARRLVAVGKSGAIVASASWRSTPSTRPNSDSGEIYPVATGMFDTSFYGSLMLDISQVKEYRLETRPYEVVEFHNIHLQPLHDSSDVSANPEPHSAISSSADHVAKILRSAYAAGEGRMGILNVPQTWNADMLTFRSAQRVTNVTVNNNQAIVTAHQEDSVIVIDPATGQRHTATADAVFEGKWKKEPLGWNAKQFACLNMLDRVDGKQLTAKDGKLKSVDGQLTVRTPLPRTYPYWN